MKLKIYLSNRVVEQDQRQLVRSRSRADGWISPGCFAGTYTLNDTTLERSQKRGEPNRRREKEGGLKFWGVDVHLFRIHPEFP